MSRIREGIYCGIKERVENTGDIAQLKWVVKNRIKRKYRKLKIITPPMSKGQEHLIDKRFLGDRRLQELITKIFGVNFGINFKREEIFIPSSFEVKQCQELVALLIEIKSEIEAVEVYF